MIRTVRVVWHPPVQLLLVLQLLRWVRRSAETRTVSHSFTAIYIYNHIYIYRTKNDYIRKHLMTPKQSADSRSEKVTSGCRDIALPTDAVANKFPPQACPLCEGQRMGHDLPDGSYWRNGHTTTENNKKIKKHSNSICATDAISLANQNMRIPRLGEYPAGLA